MAVETAIASKIAKASEFLLGAEILEDDAFDAAVSLAVSAGINAADAILLRTSGTFPRKGSHDRAQALLERAGLRQVARQLGRLTNIKSVAQYDLRRCTKLEAQQAVIGARRLVERAREIGGGYRHAAMFRDWPDR